MAQTLHSSGLNGYREDSKGGVNIMYAQPGKPHYIAPIEKQSMKSPDALQVVLSVEIEGHGHRNEA